MLHVIVIFLKVMLLVAFISCFLSFAVVCPIGAEFRFIFHTSDTVIDTAEELHSLHAVARKR